MQKFNISIHGKDLEVVRDIDGKFIIPEFMRGIGTSGLKPAVEEWILVQKPIDAKNISANVLKWGVGGINIDGCRITPSKDYGRSAARADGTIHKGAFCHSHGLKDTGPVYPSPLGRFPANLLLSHTLFCEVSPHVFPDGTTMSGCTDDCPVRMLDEQSGPCKTGDIKPGTLQGFGGGANTYGDGLVAREYKSDQASGASRFFYCAKASKRDRGEGNTHPTCKNTKLMEYLITLIAPPNGIVLDPFMGSGSTGVAAKKLGFRFIGIEKEKEYFEIAGRRIGA